MSYILVFMISSGAYWYQNGVHADPHSEVLIINVELIFSLHNSTVRIRVKHRPCYSVLFSVLVDRNRVLRITYGKSSVLSFSEVSFKDYKRFFQSRNCPYQQEQLKRNTKNQQHSVYSFMQIILVR